MDREKRWDFPCLVVAYEVSSAAPVCLGDDLRAPARLTPSRAVPNRRDLLPSARAEAFATPSGRDQRGRPMPCPYRSRRLLPAILGVFLLPPLFWCGLGAGAPTDCARRKIEARLSTASGRSVTIGRVAVGVLGGVSLHDLRIGSPGSVEEPWLQVDEASID